MISRLKQKKRDSDLVEKIYEEDVNFKNQILPSLRKSISPSYAVVLAIPIFFFFLYLVPSNLQELSGLYSYSCGDLLTHLIRRITYIFIVIGVIYGFSMKFFMTNRKTLYSGLGVAIMVSIIIVTIWYFDPNILQIPYQGDSPVGVHSAWTSCIEDEPRIKVLSLLVLIFPSFICGSVSVCVGTLLNIFSRRTSPN